MNKKILYKLLFIFTLLVCILIISNTKSFATDESRTSLTLTTTSGYSGTITDPEILSYNIWFLETSSTGCRIFLGNGRFSCVPVIDNPNQVIIKCVDENGSSVDFYSLSFIDYNLPNLSSKTLSDFNLTSAGSTIVFTVEYIENSEKTLNELPYYSDYDVYPSSRDISTVLFTSSTGSGDFFLVPPAEQATTLAPIVEGVETKKTLAEVVAILPVVLIVIVGLLAMRKAIRFLMRILKQG